MESLVSLVPEYGLYVVFAIVLIGSLGIPLPTALLVLVSGSFGASGQLPLSGVFATVLCAYILGDQGAFHIARNAGPRLVASFRNSARSRPVLERSEALLQRRGAMAVFLSHTIFSPTGPYVSYLCGAGGLQWVRFTPASIIGASVWTGFYVTVGYLFASQIEAVSQTISQFLGLILAGSVCIGCFVVLLGRWKSMKHELAVA